MSMLPEVQMIEKDVLPPLDPGEHSADDPILFVFRDKPFWIDDREEHRRQYYATGGHCCFNHILGLPKGLKDHKEKPLFDYEVEIVEALGKYKRLWIKKARGLGITELMLRYMAWLCLKDDVCQGGQMAIIVGPREEGGTKLITRMKERIGLQKFFQFDTNAKTLILNGCTIESYPSNHTETLRSPEKMLFILLDECDFFAINETRVVIDAAEGYTAKSNPWIVMVSTPNMPGGFYDGIENDPESPYHKIIILFDRGMPELNMNNLYGATTWEGAVNAAVVATRYKKLDDAAKASVARLVQDQLVKPGDKFKIYSMQDVLDAATLQSWPREYNGRYGYGVGNIFPQETLREITQEEYSLALDGGQKVLFYDPGFANDKGGSKFAILGCEMVEGIIYTKHCMQIQRASLEAMLEQLAYLYHEHGYHLIRGDSSRPDIVRALAEGSEQLKRKACNVEAIVFRDTLTEMSNIAPTRVREKQVRIHPTHTDLINQLRAVEYDGKGHPDKKKLRFDLGDCFFMAMYHYDVGDVAVVKVGNDLDYGQPEAIMDHMGVGTDSQLYQPF